MKHVPPSPATRKGETQPRYLVAKSDDFGWFGFAMALYGKCLIAFVVGYLLGALFRIITQ